MLHDFMQSHICLVHSCLTLACHLHFWQNDQNLLCATVGNTGGGGGGGGLGVGGGGVEQIPKESAQKVDCGEENSPAGTRTLDLLITSLALYH